MKSKSQAAVETFLSGYNCAQSVLLSHFDETQMDKNIALKLSCGFGAGMGRNEEVCGAVSGGIIAIGLKHGKGINDTDSNKEKTYKLTKELMNRFESKHGTYICRKLLRDCDLMTENGQQYFIENDLKTKVCCECIKSAVEILEDIL